MDRARLRQILTQYFDAGELRTLCFDLGVDYDDLPGEGKANKARELISYLERRDRVHGLIELVRRRRPNIPWEETPEATGEEADSFQGASFEQLQAEVESLRRQLAEEEGNLRLIEEQKSKYVLETDVPLGLIKEERAKREKIASMRARLSQLQGMLSEHMDRPFEPPDARRDSLRAQLDMAEKVLAVYEQQAAGYTTLTIPAHLAVNLEEQREKVARLRAQLRALDGGPAG